MLLYPTIITLSINDYLDKAFCLIPANANIKKGRCGIGGTTLEILAKRNSIIIVPTNGITKDKRLSHPFLFSCNGDVTEAMVAEYLKKDIYYKKIITTPDSFKKIINAAKSLDMYEELKDSFFLLIDESHSAVTEKFRERMLEPFKYLWDFKEKTFISATPFAYSNPRFMELSNYEIKFYEPFIDSITIVDTDNVNNYIDQCITGSEDFERKSFFFYNSVTEIAEVIRRNNLIDCHIYCADKNENYEKLDENLEAFAQQPLTGEYKKFNFFTSKYFEGFDLIEDNARIYIVTDICKAHTRMGISNKAVQAAGRIRVKPDTKKTHEIIHITNHRNINTMKTIDDFRKEYSVHTSSLIDSFNQYMKTCKAEGVVPLDDQITNIKKFANLDEITGIAIYNYEKVDQIINELVCNEDFNNLSGIVKAWENALYEVAVVSFKSSCNDKKRRKSKADRLKEAINEISTFESNKDTYIKLPASKKIKQLQQSIPLAFDAYYELGIDVVESLGYNEKKIHEALRAARNKKAEVKILAYLDSRYHVGKTYQISDMVKDLQFTYSKYGVTNVKTGDIKIAKATHFDEFGFKIHKTKIQASGKAVNAYLIQEKYFKLSDVA